MKQLFQILCFLYLTILSNVILGQTEVITNCGGSCTFEQLTAEIDINVLEKVGNTLWIGTNGGLVRYDLTTDNYQKFTTNDGLRHNSVSDLVVNTERDIVWIMTAEGLCRLEDNCFSYEKKFSNKYPYRGVFFMELDSENRLWLGSPGWACILMRYDEANEELLVFEDFDCHGTTNSTKKEIVDFEADKNGDMWLLVDPDNDDSSTALKTLMRYVDAQNTFETVVENIDWAGFTLSHSGNLKLDKNNNLWISNSALLYKYDIENKELNTYGELNNRQIVDFTILDTGTDDDEVYHIKDYGSQVFINLKNEQIFLEIGDSRPKALYNCDNELWIASNLGVFKLDKNNSNVIENYSFVKTLQLDDSFKDNHVLDMKADAQDNIWVTYRNSAYTLSRFNQGAQMMENIKIEGANYAEKLLFDGEKIWFRDSRKLFEQVSNDPVAFNLIPNPSNKIYYTSNLVNHQSSIYVGGGEDLHINDTTHTIINSLYRVNEMDSLVKVIELDGGIKSIASDQNSRLYIAAESGFYVYENDNLTLLEETRFNPVFFDSINQKLWLSNLDVEYNEQHLYQYENGNLTKANYFYPSNSPFFFQDNDGILWFSGGDGLSNINGEGPFNTTNGFPSTYNIQAMTLDSNNKLWIGSVSGIATYERENFITASQTTVCRGESVRLSTNLDNSTAFQWQIKQNNQVLLDTTASSFDYILDTSGGVTVTLSAEINGCTKTDVQSIYSYEPADLTWASTQYSLCDASTVTLIAPFNMQKYEWRLDGEILGTERYYETNQAGEYTLYIEGFCGTNKTFAVNVEPNLEISLQCSFSTDSPDLTTLYTSTRWEQNATYLWSTGDTTSTITVSPLGVYGVTVTLYGCVDATIIDASDRCILPTDIDEVQTDSSPQISIFPNPSSDFIHIQLASSHTEKIQLVQLFDLKGQLLKTVSNLNQTSRNKLSIKDLSTGIYFLQIQTAKGHLWSKKIIKE